jgi:hypothetical protein
MSVLGWVLVGLAVRLVVVVVLEFVVGHFVRPDRVPTLDLLRARVGPEAPAQPTASTEQTGPVTDADLPAPREGDHDDVAPTSRGRRDP